MCAEGRSRDVCLARTVREWAGLRRGWEARLQDRGLQVRFLPGLYVGQAISSFTVRRHLVSWVYIGSRTNDSFLGGLGGLATHTRRTSMNETTPWPLKYVPKNLDEAALTPELRSFFERFLSSDTIPGNLILHGLPGFVKTSIADIIAERYRGRGASRVDALTTGNV